MYRIFWISVIVLIASCGGKSGKVNTQALASVGGYLAQVDSLDKSVSLYGYLTKKNGVLFLYHDQRVSSFSSIEAEKLRIRIYIPDNKFDPKCLDGYVSLYGISHKYLGEIAIDDILRVVSLADDNLCYSEPEPLNYFDFLKNRN